MKPKPLDLELDKKIEKIADYILELLEFYNLSKEEKKELKETLMLEIDDFREEIKQRIKSACEFYLRYKDNPNLLSREREDLHKIAFRIFGYKLVHSVEFHKIKDEYNEWLFKLAFKGVLKERDER
jgi:DNA repair exonuclease SbcCD nuclease subunit